MKCEVITSTSSLTSCLQWCVVGHFGSGQWWQRRLAAPSSPHCQPQGLKTTGTVKKVLAWPTRGCVQPQLPSLGLALAPIHLQAHSPAWVWPYPQGGAWCPGLPQRPLSLPSSWLGWWERPWLLGPDLTDPWGASGSPQPLQCPATALLLLFNKWPCQILKNLLFSVLTPWIGRKETWPSSNLSLSSYLQTCQFLGLSCR